MGMINSHARSFQLGVSHSHVVLTSVFVYPCRECILGDLKRRRKEGRREEREESSKEDMRGLLKRVQSGYIPDSKRN